MVSGEPIYTVNPRYPTDLYNNPEGWVRSYVLVDKQGIVKGVKVIAAQPKRTFERSARKALSRWRYSAATYKGQPVPVVYEVQMEFVLK